mmetsp:Transcript_8075/g.14266  ORF Transcript_8075/g.14266 Transcript_8075/m.14266 type:complete len:205 (-) Transcript_8075:11-625(-)
MKHQIFHPDNQCWIRCIDVLLIPFVPHGRQRFMMKRHLMIVLYKNWNVFLFGVSRMSLDVFGVRDNVGTGIFGMIESSTVWLTTHRLHPSVGVSNGNNWKCRIVGRDNGMRFGFWNCMICSKAGRIMLAPWYLPVDNSIHIPFFGTSTVGSEKGIQKVRSRIEHSRNSNISKSRLYIRLVPLTPFQTQNSWSRTVRLKNRRPFG